ncbi:mitochondrial import receptor protein [Blyttiomyces sp. JEL0837]|nr:mitochondrial import receptor protein [Blyttiomyces sp. JEL0837]
MVELHEIPQDGEEERDEDYVTEDDFEEDGFEEDQEDDDVEDAEDEDDLDDEDDDLANESFAERLAALADVIPPTTRYAAYKAVTNTISTATGFAKVAGKGIWIIATGALLVMLPVALEVERETFAIQQEHQQRLRENQAQVLAGAGGPGAPEKK